MPTFDGRSPKSVLRKAITAKCKDCIYDPADLGNHIQQIEMCTSTDCPLWQYRPISSSQRYKDREVPYVTNH